MKGQALIILLFFAIIAINVTAAATVIILVNSLSGSKFQQGTVAYEIAQAGAENARLRLLRDPNYTGETLAVGNGNAVIIWQILTHAPSISVIFRTQGRVVAFYRRKWRASRSMAASKVASCLQKQNRAKWRGALCGSS